LSAGRGDRNRCNFMQDGCGCQRFNARGDGVSPIQIVHRPQMGIIRLEIFDPRDLVPGDFEIERRLSVRQHLNNKQGNIQDAIRDKRVLGPEPFVFAKDEKNLPFIFFRWY